MAHRAAVTLVKLLALPLALFSATPSVQWCAQPPVPLSPEEFAACLVSEFTGCTAQVECSAASCTAQDSPSCPPSLACEDAVRTTEGESRAGCAAADQEPSPAGHDRAFCVGNPAGGFGVRPSLDEDSRPLVADLAAFPPEVRSPAIDRGTPLAAPPFEPIPDPPEAATPIRGPPLA